MPPTRTARTRNPDVVPANVDVDSESGGDTDNDDQPTPKPQRTTSRKRLSEAAFDPSFTTESGRPPPKSVNINDDAAEKRRRRQSTRPTAPVDENEAGPSEDRAAAHARQKQQLLSVAEAPAIDVPLDVMNSNFEEWMKMATDNKINAANSWNFALIDYFHDMSLLRNNTDNTINFQRASCTLDGCVKIWTSRVDSVGTETGKLLSNLANEGRIGADDEDDDEDGEGGDLSQPKKRKTHRPASTLAKDVAQLRNKKLDLEFRVDPLFRKTCADFDEGGAQGLLMNHLSLGVGSDGTLRVVFDASDSRGQDPEEEQPAMEEPFADVDLTHLREQFLPDLDELDEKAICHSLEGFSFSKDSWSFDDTTTLFRDDHALEHDDDNDDNEPAGFNEDFNDMPLDADGAAPVEDFFMGDQAVNDDYIQHDPASPSMGGSENGMADEAREPGVNGGAPAPFDPRKAPNERDLVMAMTEGEGGMMYDYFDQTLLKNWAGPEHWKLRKVVRRPEATEPAKKPQRERKEAFKIDFMASSEKSAKELAKDLFVPPTRGAATTLPGPSLAKKTKRKGKGKDKAKETEDKRFDNTLPDDMHFSSKQLVTLFLKPKFSLKTRGQRGRLDDRPEGEVDENFWAQAAADQAAGRSGAEEDLDATQNGGAIPFNTQFFHDDYDDAPGFDDVYDADGGDVITAAVEPGEQDLLALSQGQRRRVRPERVNYAKRAKRVDVRKLKDNIWKSLDIVVPESEQPEEDAMDLDDRPVESRPVTDPAESRVFDNVISGLQKSYPKDKMDEISTSFCFICLLHLANERGLKLESGNEDTIIPDDAEDKKVGNIWDLKVYRDPDATPAA